MSASTVLVADSHRLLAESLASCLDERPEFEAVASAATTATHALRDVARSKPDLAMVDCTLPGMEAFGLIRSMVSSSPKTYVVATAWLPHDIAATEAAAVAGARLTVSKTVCLDRLPELLNWAMNRPDDLTPADLDPRIPVRGGIASDRRSDEARTLQADLEALSPRQIEVLQHLSAGRSTKQIAADLGITAATVRKHVDAIRDSTGAQSQIEAVSIARRGHFVTDAPLANLTGPAALGGSNRKRPPHRIRVAVADAQHLFADALAEALSRLPQLDVILEVVGTGDAALGLVAQYDPEVLLLDTSIPGTDAFHVTEALMASAPRTKVLLLSRDHPPNNVAEGLAAGAVGVLPRTITLSELAEAILLTHTGDPIVYGHQLAAMIDVAQASDEQLSTLRVVVSSLSEREIQALRLLDGGGTTKQIAAQLGMPVRTVRTVIHRLIEKLGAHSRLEALALARQAGALSVGE